MSLRRKVLLVFLVVNVLTLGGLILYVREEGAGARSRFDETGRLADRRATAVMDLLKVSLKEGIDRELKQLLRSEIDEGQLIVRISELPVFHNQVFKRLVAKGVLLHLGDRGFTQTYFNLGRDYIFEEGTFVRPEVRRMVAQSLLEDRLIEEGGRLAGPLRVDQRDWGGFYLSLADLATGGAAADYDPALPLRNLLLILAPGLLFLIGFTWVFLSRSVLEPLEDLGRVARAVSSGDYSRRLPRTDRKDEIGRLTMVVNRMLALVEEYRDEMEARVLEKTREIEQKNRQLMLGQRLAATGTLAAGIAHEINNPLGGMLNAVQRLRRPTLTKEQREQYFALLEECIQRIGSIVQRVLDVSPRKTTPASVFLPDVVRRAIELVRHRAQQKGIQIFTEFSESLPPILGESNELGQVFLNLLINGVDAGRASGRLVIRLRPERDTLVAEVEDDGVGMDKDVAARAFDLFFTTKGPGEGTGLGLATVYSLVENHGGTMELWSEPGVGTRFTLRFPVLSTGHGEPTT